MVTVLFLLPAAGVAQQPVTDLDLLGVWGAAPDDVWAVGVTRQSDESVGLYHFDGNTWAPGQISQKLHDELFPDAPSNTLQFNTISGNASNNIYAVVTRSDQDARFVVRYDGTQWDIHAFVSSDKYLSSFVDPDTGDVFIGGRGFSGGGTVVRRAPGGENPTSPAAQAYAIQVNSSAQGFGAAGLSGASSFVGSTNPVTWFMATSNGLWQAGGNTVGIQRPPINGLNAFQNATDVVVVPEPDNVHSVLVTYHRTGFRRPEDQQQSRYSVVGIFDWDGSTLQPAGDTNSPAWTLGYGFLGSLPKIAACRSVPGDGSPGPVDIVYGISTILDGGLETGSIAKYNFASKEWEEEATTDDPLNDVFCFSDGSAIAVGKKGTIITILPPLEPPYVWDNSVEDQGDHNFHGATGGPTNWLIEDTNDRQPEIKNGVTYKIVNGDVQIFEQPVNALSIRSTGSLSVEQNLTLGNDGSHIQNLMLGADLALGGQLTLTGDTNAWTSGDVTGGGYLVNNGMFTIDAGDQTVEMLSRFETWDGARTVMGDGELDLRIDGTLVIFPGGVFEFGEGKVTSREPSASFTNNGIVRKAGSGTGTIDVALYEGDPTARVEVTEGTLAFTGAGQLIGVMETGVGATTRFFTGSYTLGSIDGDKLTVRGEGPVEVENAALLVSAGGEVVIEETGTSGGLRLIGDQAVLYGNGRVYIRESGQIRVLPDIHVEINSQLFVQGALELGAGRTTIDPGQGSFSNDGTMIIRPGADVTVQSVETDFNLIPPSQVFPIWGLGSGEYLIQNGSLELIPSGESGPVDLNGISADTRVSMDGPNAKLNNLPTVEGLMTVFGRLQLQKIDFSVTNNGLVEVLGQLVVGPGTNLVADRMLVADGGYVFLNTIGTLPTELENNGIIEIGASPGSASIPGDYSQSGTGLLKIEIGGLDPGRDFDLFTVGGTATLEDGAMIEVTLIDPNPEDDDDEVFLPRTDDVFSFLSAGEIVLPAGKTLADFVEFTNLPEGVDLTLDLLIESGTTTVALTATSTLTPPPGPRIRSHPAAMTPEAGQPVTFTVAADSADTFTYQWRLNGIDIPGATDSTYTLPSAQAMHAGDYSVVVTADGESVTSRMASLQISPPAPNDARLLNLSTRAQALTGDDVLIPGFVIAGSGQKEILIRAVGASLRGSPFNIETALEDPQMVLKRWNGSAFEDVDSNDNWESNPNSADILQRSMDLGAFALTDSRDAVLLKTLEAGQYTVVAGGVDDLTGVAIVELYDADDPAGDATMVNISNRGFVGTGASIMIPGITVSPEGPKTFLIRAVGPALNTLFGLTGVLEDPQMAVYSGLDLILENDDWGDSIDAATAAAVAAQVGAFALPAGSKDAAMVVTLPPGNYTIHASGAGGATGIALVEVYIVE